MPSAYSFTSHPFSRQGIDEAVQMMGVGDVYDLIVPADLAFGPKGRRASAGKPSIPPGSTINFTLTVTSLPGKEDELLEVTGGSLDE
jgi:peptidylprolyl isomerase